MPYRRREIHHRYERRLVRASVPRDARLEHVAEYAPRLGMCAHVLESRCVKAHRALKCDGAAPSTPRYPDYGEFDCHLPREVLATCLALGPCTLPAVG